MDSLHLAGSDDSSSDHLCHGSAKQCNLSHDSIHLDCCKRQRLISVEQGQDEPGSDRALPSACHDFSTSAEIAGFSVQGSVLSPSHSHSSIPDYHMRCTGFEEEEEEAESCCEGGSFSCLDVGSFFLPEGWEDTFGESEAFAVLNLDAVFLNDGISSPPAGEEYSSDDAVFAGCSGAENGNWFLNEMEGQGNAFLNELLDQEWMATAVANLDRINDTVDADICVLHLLESENAAK